MTRVRASLALWGLGLLLLLRSGPPASADDVPEPVRKDYAAALELLAKGDAKKAFSAISRAKEKAGASVDVWEAFVRIWRANGKPEATLWDVVVAKKQAESPASPVFDLVRARLEADPAKKEEHLRAAIAKDAKAPGPRILLARLLVSQAKDDEAGELLDAVLAECPDQEDALVLKAEMDLGGGFARSAADFAEERLAKKESAALRHLLARAYLKLSGNDVALMEKAVENARKAVETRPDPEYVATLADLLDRKKDLKGAVALLETHVAKNPSPLLTGMLGGYAFRNGQYESAAKALVESAKTNVQAAKALALCHVRLGKAGEARAAFEQVLRLDPKAGPFVARHATLQGDLALARKHLQGASGPEAEFLLCWCAAWEGNVAETTRLTADRGDDGSRRAEVYAATCLLSRAFQRLGPKAEEVRKRILEGRSKAGRAGLPRATVASRPPVQAKSTDFMERWVTYQRSICGTYFEPGDMTISMTLEDGKARVGIGFPGLSDCVGDEHRVFVFNTQVLGDAGSFQPDEFIPSGTFQAAFEAFRDACRAAVKGDMAAAEAGFGKALEEEPAWAAAKLMRAAVRIVGAIGDPASAATEAKEAMEGVPDEFDLRRLAIVVRSITGVDVSNEWDALGASQEACSDRNMAGL